MSRGRAEQIRAYTCTCGQANENGTCRRCAERYLKKVKARTPTLCEPCGLTLHAHPRCKACTILVGPAHISKLLIGDICQYCVAWRQDHKKEAAIPGLNAWSDLPDGMERTGLVVRKSQPPVATPEHCRRGHAYLNTAVWRDGKRYCKTCEAITVRERTRKREMGRREGR